MVGPRLLWRRPISSGLRQTGLQSLIRLLESCDQLTSFPTLTLISVGGPRHGRSFSIQRLHLLGEGACRCKGAAGPDIRAVQKIWFCSADPEAYEANYRVRDIDRL